MNEQGNQLKGRDAIDALGFRTEEIEIGDGGGVITVKELTGRQVETMKKKLDKSEEFANARFIAMSVVDDQGNLVYNADDPFDLRKINDRPLSFIMRVVQRLRKLNGIDAKSMEDAEKN